MTFVDKDLLSVQESRILMERAGEAAGALAAFPQEKLDQILEAMLQAVHGRIDTLSRMSAEETGYGNEQDKCRKDRFLLGALAGRLRGMRCVGFLEEDEASGVATVGVPMGVILALCPAAGPVAAVVSAAAMAVKSGNAVVFAPHPRAERTVRRTVEILAEAACRAGLPDGAILCPGTVTREGTLAFLGNPSVSMILDTGAPEYLEAAAGSGKPVIFGGIVPGPVFIERSADVARAVEDILSSRSFDCGILAAAEQYVVADGAIAQEARREMEKRGAYFMSAGEEEALVRLLGIPGGGQDPETVGKSAAWLAKRSGFAVPEGTRVLVSQQRYISDENPYARPLLCPVLVFYIENDWMRACEKCMELLAGDSRCHTLAIHCRDEAVIRQFALKKPVGRILVNTPAALGAFGATTNLFPSVTLGAVNAGQGITSDNVSPMNLVYLRRVAEGVENDMWEAETAKTPWEAQHLTGGQPEAQNSAGGQPDAAALLRMILDQLTIE